MKQTLTQVASNLYRSHESRRYYAIITIGGKQVRASLKTTDPAVAKLKLRKFLADHESKPMSEPRKNPTFRQLASDFESTKLPTRDLKQTSLDDCLFRIKALLKHGQFADSKVSTITTIDCDRWFGKRRRMLHQQRLNNEMYMLRDILDYAVECGYIFRNPVAHLKKLKVPKSVPNPPTKEEFRLLVKTLRERKNEDAAEMVELLAYSGLRKSEAAELRWQDIDFERGRFGVCGKGRRTGEMDYVPLFPALRDLLLRIKARRRGVRANERILRLGGCRNAIINACKSAGLRQFTHPDMRKFFSTNCLEAGLDFKTVSSWLRHKDGGTLLASVYSHLRSSHSRAMADKVTVSVLTGEGSG